MSLFIAVYLAALFCYLFTRNSGNKLYRSLNKYLMATMYLVLAFVMFFRHYSFVSYQTLLMAALILAWFGDVFLVFDFSRGGDFFLAGNICFALYEQIVLVDNGYGFKDICWIWIVAGIMLIAFILACHFRPDLFRLGKMRWPMTFYLSSIFTHGITGLALMLMLPGTSYAMMGLGSLLFMISDMILTTYKFVLDNNIWLIRANSLTYFTGLLLIVLSTVR
ncbi:MAG: hypothetical protein J5796_01985 [Erysipelotrichaceae bacterium]|nr:hypothetical protein [Erysipelotrichaceae bacterium]